MVSDDLLKSHATKVRLKRGVRQGALVLALFTGKHAVMHVGKFRTPSRHSTFSCNFARIQHSTSTNLARPSRASVQVVRRIRAKFRCRLGAANSAYHSRIPAALNVRSHAAKQRQDVRHGESFHLTGGLVGNELIANRPVHSRLPHALVNWALTSPRNPTNERGLHSRGSGPGRCRRR